VTGNSPPIGTPAESYRWAKIPPGWMSLKLAHTTTKSPSASHAIAGSTCSPETVVLTRNSVPRTAPVAVYRCA
jgi:hypothetical protein